MAHLIQLTQHASYRGDLTVFERILPGSLKRIFYVTNADGSIRGGHRHHRAWQAVVCLQGGVEIVVERADTTTSYVLDSPDQCLVLEPEDWNLLRNFRDTAIVLVVSNEYYEADDYIYERYAGKANLGTGWPALRPSVYQEVRMRVGSHPRAFKRTGKLLLLLSGLILGLLSCRKSAVQSSMLSSCFQLSFPLFYATYPLSPIANLPFYSSDAGPRRTF